MSKIWKHDPAALLAAVCLRAGAMPPGRDRTRLLLLALILSHTSGERAMN